MDTLSDAAVLVAVADAGSISAAARHRGVSQPALSRAVARVEARLGVALLDRSSRKVRLTAAGARFVDGARRLLRDARALEAATAASGGRFAGSLRLSLPPALAHKRLLPPVLDWCARHRGVRVELLLEYRVVDLVAEDVDLAVRVGPLPDSGLIGRRLGSYAHLVVASPRFLRGKRPLLDPRELAEHPLIAMRTVGPNTSWPFTRGRTQRTIDVKPALITNDGEALVAAAAAGLGITVATDYHCAEQLAAGTLVRVLEDWSLPSAPITALSTRAAAGRPAVRGLLAHLARALAPGAREERRGGVRARDGAERRERSK